MNAIITITEKAQNQIKHVFESEKPDKETCLRVGVIGGGCSGLTYKIKYDQLKESDNIIELDGIKVIIDPKSAIYLKDVTLDFEDGLNGKGFVFKNPNAENTCGCGESFSV